MLAIGIPVSPSPTTGDGSWVWLVVAVVLVFAVLAVTWIAGLWGRAAQPQEPQTDDRHPSMDEQLKAA